MSVVANVAINVDAANAIQQLNRLRDAAKALKNLSIDIDASKPISQLGAVKGAADRTATSFDNIKARAKGVQSAIEASQGGFAKASTVQAVFSARVLNTEQAILAQIAALRQVQSQVILGGALYQKAGEQINMYKEKLDAAKKALNDEDIGQSRGRFEGLGAAVAALAAKLALVATAAKVFKASITAAFEGAASENRLKNVTGSFEEYQAALAASAQSAQKFGLTTTETNVALADLFGRLKGVGFGLKESVQIYEGFNVIARQSGLDAAEASGAFFQLSQALGKGKLNGDEFVTIAERLPQLLDAVAATTGRSRSELTNLAAEGFITSQVLFEALSGAADGAGNLNAKLTDQQIAANNLKRATNELLTSIGKIFTPAVTAATEQFSLALVGIKDSLPTIQAAFGRLTGFLVAIGQAALPAINSGFEFLKGNIKGIIQIAAFFGTFVGILKGIVLATQAWTAASVALANGQKIAAVASAALQAILNPASIAKSIVAIAGAAAVSFALGQALDAATQDAVKFKDGSVELNGPIDEILKKYSSLPPVIETAKQKQERLKEEAKDLKQEVAQVKAEYDKLINAQSVEINALENSLTVIQAREKAEQDINNAVKSQLEAQLQQTDNQSKRQQLAKKIFEIEVANAQSNLRLTKEQINNDLIKAQAAVRTQFLKAQELKVELALTRARGQNTFEIERAISAQKSTLKIAIQNLDATKETAKAQLRGAEATFKAVVNAAQLKANLEGGASAANSLANSAERIADATAESAAASSQGGAFPFLGGAGRIQNPILRAAAISVAEEARANKIDSFAGGAAAAFAVEDFTRQARLLQKGEELLRAYQQLIEQGLTAEAQAGIASLSDFEREAFRAAKALEDQRQRAEQLNSTLGALTGSAVNAAAALNNIAPGPNANPEAAFAAGGYVTRPTRALVAEAGEPEYIIPRSKMTEAMQRYAAGARGEAVIPGGGSTLQPQVNITTGPVMQMNGTSYVTQADLVTATSTAAKQGASMALQMLQNSPKARRNAGVTR